MNSLYDQQQLRFEPFRRARQFTWAGAVARGMLDDLNSRAARTELGLRIRPGLKPKEVTAALRGLGAVVAITGKDQGVPVMAAPLRAAQEIALAGRKGSGPANR